MPFPLPTSDELNEFLPEPCLQLIPKDISQNSLCSSVQTPLTETTDDGLSPVDCCNYFPDKNSELKHRNFNEHFLAPDAQYEVVQDQVRQNSSNLTNTISGLNNYGSNYYNQNKPNFSFNSTVSPKNVPPKSLNLNQQQSPSRRNIGSNISALIQNLGGNPAGLLYGEANSADDEEVQGQACHSDGTMDSGWHSGSEKNDNKKQEQSSDPVNV